MSFTIILQKNKSELNRVNKDIEDIITIDGSLKNPTSIIDPVIIIESDLAIIANCNYLTIPIFSRSYFVNNIRSIRTNLIEFSCHVDVLSSFSEQIKNNTAIIKRQETEWNLYLNDGSFRVYQNPVILTKAFPSGFTTQEFVLAIAGG